MIFAFYEHDKYIGEFDLADENDAEEKAIELTFALSPNVKNAQITYKEVKDGKKEVI